MTAVVPILRSGEAGFARAFARVRAVRAADASRAEAVARSIVQDVRRRGDRALVEYTRRFDEVVLTPASFAVRPQDLRAAAALLPPTVRAALRLAARRIRAFHVRQRQASWRYRDPIGLVLGQQITPLRRVGVYVPGGHAAYPSSVLMNVIPARVAGVDEVIMVSPAGRAGHAPAVLAAAHIAGATAVYRIGGAQAVAALAYGTRTIAPVDKIVGPGNAFVQAAKRLVYGQVDIDSTAGPSEVLVIADTSARPAYVAADLLAQAEHGSGDECALLLTPSSRLAAAVQVEIGRQLAVLPRRAAIAGVLRRRGALVVVRDLDEAVELAEQVAPEHLELMVRDPPAPRQTPAQRRRDLRRRLRPGAARRLRRRPEPRPADRRQRALLLAARTYDFVKRTSVVSASAARAAPPGAGDRDAGRAGRLPGARGGDPRAVRAVSFGMRRLAAALECSRTPNGESRRQPALTSLPRLETVELARGAAVMPAAQSRAALKRKERNGRVTRTTKETDITVELARRRRRQGGGRHRRARSSTTCSTASRATASSISPCGRAATSSRPAPHGRGRRADARPGAARGARRQGRHPPLRRRRLPARRGAGARRRRPQRPAVPRLRRADQARRASATSTPSWCTTSSSPSPTRSG